MSLFPRPERDVIRIVIISIKGNLMKSAIWLIMIKKIITKIMMVMIIAVTVMIFVMIIILVVTIEKNMTIMKGIP